jgi:hypothetical protein
MRFLWLGHSCNVSYLEVLNIGLLSSPDRIFFVTILPVVSHLEEVS